MDKATLYLYIWLCVLATLLIVSVIVATRVIYKSIRDKIDEHENAQKNEELINEKDF